MNSFHSMWTTFRVLFNTVVWNYILCTIMNSVQSICELFSGYYLMYKIISCVQYHYSSSSNNLIDVENFSSKNNDVKTIPQDKI